MGKKGAADASHKKAVLQPPIAGFENFFLTRAADIALQQSAAIRRSA
jgi:hypothetical protein